MKKRLPIALCCIITLITMLFFYLYPAIPYLPDDLDFEPMEEEEYTAPSGRYYTIPSINYKMVYIPPGEFMMGSPEDEEGRYSDEKLHRVRITRGFYMGVTEVTVGQWKRFVEETGYRTQAEREGGAWIWTGKWEKKKGYYWDNPGFSQTDDHPVTCISWYDVQKFIEWLNKKAGKQIYRLPTEAEWEYACRAGTRKPDSGGMILMMHADMEMFMI